MDGLFSLGSNGSGQLGVGHKEDISVPKQVKFAGQGPHGKITRVAAGGNHTILLSDSGKAYWSGDATNGCCGIVDDAEKDSTEFREVSISKTQDPGTVAFVACTWDSTVFVTADESGKATRVYTCGSQQESNSGPSASSGDGSKAPTLVSDFPPAGTHIIDIAAGFRHIVVVLANGDAYGWGNGRKGQLGEIPEVSEPKGLVKQPRKIKGVDFKVAKAVCCQYTTCLTAEPGDGRIQVLGADKWKLQSNAPVEVPNWKSIDASWGSIYILQRNGTVLAWGRDDHGQLPPPGLPELADIAAGSEHVLALTEDGQVLAWGWGEHGNCGPQTEKFGDVKGRWNVLASLKNLSEGSSITAIGAGCATSWIEIAADGVFL
ncbi:RCC1/BLIP-II [Xylariomycetidae sp. FL0641]|nr:RCC1/BLIP-II [Xylariomycetidae sp. FL0641]